MRIYLIVILLIKFYKYNLKVNQFEIIYITYIDICWVIMMMMTMMMMMMMIAKTRLLSLLIIKVAAMLLRPRSVLCR